MAELRRRRVVRALIGWSVASFAVLQVVEPIMHALELPDWVLKVVVALLAAGFPATAALAWVFDLGASGVVRTPPTEPSPGAAPPPTSRRARLALLLLGLAAAGGALAFALLRVPGARSDEAAPGQRIPVAVADFENDTGEPELDALSGLLITSLEQSRRLDVLTRSRMVDILRQLGHPAAPRVDESLGREVGRQAGVRALVLAAIHRFDTVYTIELKALDPATSTYLFTLKEDGKGKAGVPAMIDRLSAQTRERLRERPAEVAASRVEVAEAITPSLEAYHHYFAGKTLASSQGEYRKGILEFQRAVAIDPGFAMANFEIAYLGDWVDLPEPERRAALDAALRKVDRVPGKERELMLAWKAHQDGRDEEADAIYQRAVQAYPREWALQFHAGDLRFHAFLSPHGSTRDLDDVLPFFKAAAALDSTEGENQSHLITCLLFLGRAPEAVAAARAWVAASPVARAYGSLASALSVDGQAEEALQAYRRAAELGNVTFNLGGHARLLALQGRFAEADRLLASAPPSPSLRPMEQVAVGAARVELLLLRGRYREAEQALGAIPEGLAVAERRGVPARVRVAIHATRSEPKLAWAAAQPLVARDGVDLAPLLLAQAGDLTHAAEAARRLTPGSRQLAFHEAVAAWKAGRVEEAAGRLEALAAGKYAPDRALASGLLGELEAERGRDGPAIQALERYRAAATLQWSWVDGAVRLPRTLLLLARCYQRSGDRTHARERLDTLLAWWSGADPDLQVRREALALDARLVAATR